MALENPLAYNMYLFHLRISNHLLIKFIYFTCKQPFNTGGTGGQEQFSKLKCLWDQGG